MLFFFVIRLIFTSGAKAMVGKTVGGPFGRIKAMTQNYTGSYILHHHALAIKIKCQVHLRMSFTENSLVVQWLGLCTFTAQVQSLVGELRSHKLSSVTKNKTKQKIV